MLSDPGHILQIKLLTFLFNDKESLLLIIRFNIHIRTIITTWLENTGQWPTSKLGKNRLRRFILK